MIDRSGLALALGILCGSSGALHAQAATARRADTGDVLHGERVADPYRWLEDLQSAETRRWTAGQDSFARARVAGPERDGWRRRIERLARVRRLSPPWERAGRLFFLRYNTSGGAADVTLYVARSGLHDAREIRLSEDPARSPVRALYPALRAPLTIFAAGVEASSWRFWGVYDIAAERMLADTLHDVHSASAAAWGPGDSAFYYTRYRTPPRDSLRTAQLTPAGLYLHRLGTPQSADSLVYSVSDRRCVVAPYTPEAGSFVIVQELCAGGVNSLVAVLPDGNTTLARGEELVYRYAGSVGDTMYWQTNAQAPNHKVVSLRLVNGRAQWETIVPERELPLFAWSSGGLGTNLVGRTLLLAYQKDAIADVRAYDLDRRTESRVTLPEIGSIWSGFVGSPYSSAGFYSVSGVATPGRIYRIDTTTGRSTLWADAPIDLPVDSIVTEQVFVTAADGTRFPMFVVRRSDTPQDGTAPAWIYGYGFGDWSASPWFQPHVAEFINQGGVWALPNIRGGAEYGERWSAAGSREHKQNSITDFIAASDHLIEHRYTAARRIVANASSAGGIVAAAAMIQRPELYGALVLDYPVLDMLRYHLFTVASTWAAEYGTVEKESEFRALRALSAPHTLTPGTCYPPVFVAPGEQDPVTPPFHAYKFVAALQHAQGCSTHPALLRVAWGAGHSSGLTLDDRIDMWADQLAFVGTALTPARGSRATASPPHTGAADSVWIDPAWRSTAPAPVERPNYATIWFDRQYVDSEHNYVDRVAQHGANGRSVVRRAVIDTLKQLHDASWQRARPAVEALQRNGTLSGCERHWIVNSLTCAVRGDVEQLRAIPGASRIYFAGQAPVPGGAAVAGADLARPTDESDESGYVPDAGRAPRGHQLLHVDRVWRELGLTGKGVLHVIHDVGWTLTQPLIRATLWRNPAEIAGNGRDDDGNGYSDDVHGFDFDNGSPDVTGAGAPILPGGSTHGDLTAAIAAGRALGDTALIVGVAPNSRWAAVVNNFVIERSLEWAIELDAHTYSMSFSIPNLGEYRAHWRRAAEHAALAGLFLLSGAGNFADSARQNFAPVPVQMRTPEDIPLAVLGVTGVGANGERPVFASQGPVEWRTAEYGEGLVAKPDLATINANVIGFDREGNRFVPIPAGWFGNSFAGPHLAGVIALLIEADPELTPWRARDILMRTARDLGAPGFDAQTGAGLVDAYAAATAVLAERRR